MEAPRLAQEKPAAVAPEPAKRKKRGCLKSCLVFFVVLFLLIGGFVASALGLPRKWGLVKSKTEKVFDTNEADRYVAEDLRAALETEGIATKGMEIYVLPERDGEGASAYVVLDEAAGFSFSPSSDEGVPFLGTLASLAKSEAAKEGGVDRVAFEYKDKQGRTLIVVSSSLQDGVDFADGKITREQFMAKVGGQIEFKNLLEAQLEELQ